MFLDKPERFCDLSLCRFLPSGRGFERAFLGIDFDDEIEGVEEHLIERRFTRFSLLLAIHPENSDLLRHKLPEEVVAAETFALNIESRLMGKHQPNSSLRISLLSALSLVDKADPVCDTCVGKGFLRGSAPLRKLVGITRKNTIDSLLETSGIASRPFELLGKLDLLRRLLLRIARSFLVYEAPVKREGCHRKLVRVSFHTTTNRSEWQELFECRVVLSSPSIQERIILIPRHRSEDGLPLLRLQLQNRQLLLRRGHRNLDLHN